MTAKHAEIAGGGICGLTTATLLAREGWSVTVHERADDIREVGSGLVVHQSSAVVFEELGILDEITAGATRFHTSEIRDKNGAVLSSRTITEDHRTFNPLRVAVIQAVHKAAMAAGVEVLTGSVATAATPDGVLRLADGSERTGDLVIAADGRGSVVRDSLPISGTKRQLTSGCTRTVIERGEFDAEDAFVEYWSGSRRMGICPTSADKTYVYFGCQDGDPRASATTPLDVDYWAEAFPVAPPEFLTRLARGEAFRHSYPYVRLKTWSAGKAAVVGDACHALPPTLGQGVGLAVGNARALVSEVAHADDIPAALRTWEKRVRSITDSTQWWSLRYEWVSSNWPKPIDRFRPVLLKATRSERIQRSMSAADRNAHLWAVPAGAR